MINLFFWKTLQKVKWIAQALEPTWTFTTQMSNVFCDRPSQKIITMTKTPLKTLGSAITLAGIMFTAGSANAASLTQTVGTIFDFTDFEQTVGIQKFNSSLGTLTGVTIDFLGELRGNAGFENTSSRPATVLLTLGADLNLSLNNQTLVALNPQSSSSYTVARYDGIRDFSGASGRTVAGLTALEFDTYTSTDNQFLQSFIGSGNLDFLFSAVALSNVRGSGNIVSFVNTEARTNIQVTYNYDPVPATVPEASAAWGVGLIAALGLLSHNKKSWLKTSNL